MRFNSLLQRVDLMGFFFVYPKVLSRITCPNHLRGLMDNDDELPRFAYDLVVALAKATPPLHRPHDYRTVSRYLEDPVRIAFYAGRRSIIEELIAMYEPEVEDDEDTGPSQGTLEHPVDLGYRILDPHRNTHHHVSAIVGMDD